MGYDVIYADPPWPYSKDLTHTNQADSHYSLMTLDDIKNLDVRGISNNPSVVFMWATSPKLHLAIETMDAWGFHYRGIAFTWVKVAKAGHVNMAGVRPSFTKMPVELCLVGSTKPKGRTLPLNNEGMKSVYHLPKTGHSVKPAEIRDAILGMFKGEHRYIELFAREKISGWDSWGNEVQSDIELGE